MKTYRRKHPSEQGSVLLITLCTALLLGLALCSYLVLTGAQEHSIIRSQRWNASLNYAEAGIEEALAQMNSAQTVSGLGYLSGNGWGSSGNTYGPVTRYLQGGSYTVSFVYSAIPAIYSTGYVTVPVSGDTVSRKVKVTVRILPLINVPLGAVDDINMNGHSVATDSWNSYDTNLSNNGYYDAALVQSNGSVASVDGIVNIGSQQIYGNLYLGPDATYSIDQNGLITGTVYYDYNVEFPPVSLPTGVTWWSAPSTNGVHVFDTDNTTLGNYFVINDSQPIVVKPGVNVTLDVKVGNFHPDDVTILGGLTNSGTLTIYQETGTATLQGNSTFPDTTWDGITYPLTRPSAFWYFGLPGVTSISLSGASTFLGVIYAPNADLSLNGGGPSGGDLQGSAIVKTVTLNGHYEFHFDESLLTNGPVRGFVPASWQEL